MANASGPATSTMSFSGGPTAMRPTALARSAAAIGWISAGGTRTVSPSVAASAIAWRNSKNCVARTIEYGPAEALIELLLRHLGAQVAALGQAVGAHHRQGDVVADAGLGLGGQQVARRGLEELEHRGVLERGRVADVDDRRRRRPARRPGPHR